MKDMAENVEDVDEIDQITQGMDTGSTEEQQVNQVETGSKGVFDDIKDVLLQDTSQRPLEGYDTEGYPLPDTAGSKRLLRAADTLLKDNLEVVVTDVLLGGFDVFKNLDLGDKGGAENGINTRPESGQQPTA
jgi:hypothetical protein